MVKLKGSDLVHKVLGEVVVKAVMLSVESHGEWTISKTPHALRYELVGMHWDLFTESELELVTP